MGSPPNPTYTSWRGHVTYFSNRHDRQTNMTDMTDRQTWQTLQTNRHCRQQLCISNVYYKPSQTVCWYNPWLWTLRRFVHEERTRTTVRLLQRRVLYKAADYSVITRRWRCPAATASTFCVTPTAIPSSDWRSVAGRAARSVQSCSRMSQSLAACQEGRVHTATLRRRYERVVAAAEAAMRDCELDELQSAGQESPRTEPQDAPTIPPDIIT